MSTNCSHDLSKVSPKSRFWKDIRSNNNSLSLVKTNYCTPLLTSSVSVVNVNVNHVKVNSNRKKAELFFDTNYEAKYIFPIRQTWEATKCLSIGFLNQNLDVVTIANLDSFQRWPDYFWVWAKIGDSTSSETDGTELAKIALLLVHLKIQLWWHKFEDWSSF